MLLLKLILSVIFWTICPFLCFLSIPFYLYRQLIKSLVKYFRPDWLAMLEVSDSVFYENLKIESETVENNEGGPGAGNELVQHPNQPEKMLAHVMTIGMILEGEPNVDKIRNFFTDHILSYKSHLGFCPFDKFYCFYDTWCGYPFWRRSKYFDLDSHVRFLEEFENKPQTTRGELEAFIGDYYRKPFPWKTPPWELVVVRNVVPERADDDLSDTDEFVTDTKKFALIFRWHRTIADCYSVANVFVKFFGGESQFDCRYDLGHGSGGYLSESSEVRLDRDSSLWKSLKSMACSFILFGYETMKLFLLDFDDNIWRIPSEVLCGSYHIVETSKLPFNIARTVSKKRKVSLEAVLFSAVSGGIRQYFIESGQQRRIPKIMRIRANFPTGGRPPSRRYRSVKLENHWKHLNVRLPISRSESWRRLEEVHKSIEQQNNSFVPKFMEILSPYFTALLPNWLNIFSLRHEGSSLTGWYFPGPKNQILILGEYPAQDFICQHPKLLSDSSLSVTTLSYNGGIKYIISADKTLFPHRESAMKLARLIEKEFLSSQNINNHYANELRD